jgi:hypothetical protein
VVCYIYNLPGRLKHQHITFAALFRGTRIAYGMQIITSEYYNYLANINYIIFIYNHLNIYSGNAIATPGLLVRFIPVGACPDIHHQRDL